MPSPRPSHTQSAQSHIHIQHIPQAQAAQELMLHSLGLIGTPYRYGGVSTQTGFDCSGMVQHVYREALGVNLPRTAQAMATAARSIQPSALHPGDLVFFNTNGKNISHVGLYIGNGEFIHSPNSRSSVRTESLNKPYYANRLVKAGTYF